MSDADRLRGAFNAFSDGIVVTDVDRLVAEWNPAASRLSGVSELDALGEPLPFATGTSEEPVELRIDDRWIEIVATALDDGGSVIELRDITHARSLEAARSMFVASTSHELKTPLTVMSGFGRWLQQHLDDDVEQRTIAVDTIVDSTDELMSLVEKILLSSRTEASADQVITEAIEVVPLLTAIADQFAVPDSAHTLAVAVADPSLTVCCDRRAMRTALGQLIENAIKYSPDGGAVVLGAEAVDDGEMVAITVADEGIGLDPDDVQYLFLAFYQGDRPITGGVGLGLSIVRRLAEAQGGTVSATGVVGEGSTFTIVLPALG